MRQVLTVPPVLTRDLTRVSTEEENELRNRALLTRCAKVTVFLPVVVHGVIYYNDVTTIALARTVSESATWTAVITTTGLFLIIGLLTGFCIRISALTDREWSYARDQIKKYASGPVFSMVPRDEQAIP